MRGALGASRARVVQQLLAEGLVLGVGGGAGRVRGRLLRRRPARWPRSARRCRAPTRWPSTARVLAFTAAIAMATGLLAAFAPAWQLTGRDANEALKTGPGRGNSSAATAASATCWWCRKWRWR